jgi:inosine-uridine nucleoside N-ribohydrolase
LNRKIKSIGWSILAFSMLISGGWSYAQEKAKKSSKPLIIFDTDMGPDYDDVGAITLLYALAGKGECEILATIASDAHPSIAPTIEVFNRYFGRPDMAVGIASAGSPGFTAPNNWNDSLITRFSKQKKAGNYPAAMEVYRKVLAKQADNSVTIVTVGFISNIRALLNSKADGYSPLSGIELVKKKVKNWVAMAGGFPQGKEFNVEKDAEASFEAFSKWPKPILFSGFEIGQQIMTGAGVAKMDINKSPVAWAYRYNLKTYDKNPQQNRPSWDQTAVLCAVRGPENYFYVKGPGKFIVDAKGFNTWNPEIDTQHYYITQKEPFERTAEVIEALMQFKP